MKSTFLLLCGALVFLSCKKDSYTNLNATLNTESEFITTYEGSPLVINLAFDKKLSEPLKIVGETHNDHNNYINNNDYHHHLEYSTDNGKTWQKGSGSYNITVPKKTMFFKLRVNTIDDSDIEVNEIFDLELSKASGQNGLNVLDSPLNFEMKVVDNEEISRAVEYSNQIILLDNNGMNFTPIAVTEAFESPELKFLLDEKKYEEIIENSVRIVNDHFDEEHDVKRFEIFSDQYLYGYVYNTGSGTSNRWAMGLNAIPAYLEVMRDEEGNFVGMTRHPYNFDGEASYTFVHEAGHILSLTNGIHIDNTIPFEDCGFVDGFNDCFVKDSWMTTFYNRFYNPETKEPVVGPEFVTDYASTNLGEDVAETITFYTILEQEDRLPKLEEDSSTAIKKLHFIGQQAEVPPFARVVFKSNPKINSSLISKKAEAGVNYLYHTSFRNRYKGKNVSCLDVHRILKEQEKQ